MISFLLCFKRLTNQNVKGFYRIYDSGHYTWHKYDQNYYICIIGSGTVFDEGNQNCLSCDENKGKYFYEEDSNSNCYSETELSNFLLTQSPPEEKAFFLDTKKTSKMGIMPSKM